MRVRAWKALAVAASLLATTAAFADASVDAPAKAHFKAATDAYRQADYSAAIVEFEASYKLKPSGVIRFNLAQCHEKLGDISGALAEYHLYLRETPDADDRSIIEKAIGNLEKRLSERGLQQLEVYSQPAGAAVTVDGKPRGQTPVSVDLSPGEHGVELQVGGYEISKQHVNLIKDRSMVLEVALLPATSKPPEVAQTAPQTATQIQKPAEVQQGPSTLRLASYAAAGVGVVALTFGLVENIQVAAKNADITNGTSPSPSGSYDQAKSAATVRDIAYIGGAAALAAGVTMFFLSPSDQPTTTVSAAPVQGGIFAVVSTKF